MDLHPPTPLSGWESNKGFPISHCSPKSSSSPDTSPTECFHLYPETSTTPSSAWISRIIGPLWMQHLSNVLQHPSKQAAQPQSAPCTVLRIHPSGTRSTASRRSLNAPQTIKQCSSGSEQRRSHYYHHQPKMSRRRSPGQPATVFHMKTRSSAQKATPDSVKSTEESSTTSAIASPSSLGTSPTPTRPQKRKLSQTDLDQPKNVPNVKRPSPDEPIIKEESPTPIVEKLNIDPMEQRQNTADLTTKANDRSTRSHPASHDGTSGSPSPRRPAKGGGRARGGGHTNGGGPKKGKQKGRAGRGGDSPEPPNRRRPLTQDERVEISMLKTRQHELKRFFAIVGAQQADILDQLATKGLSKIARKPKAHTHVPEYDTVREGLETTLEDIQEMVRTRYRLQVDQEIQRMKREKEVIQQQFKTRLEEAHKEHLSGAEGDIILFERAYRAAHDDTHTESGSDVDGFPRYHELPEPDTQPRGYVSRKIMDEKSFKLQLTSYDERARQQVLNEEVIAPLLKQMEERDNEWREEQERLKSLNLGALTTEAIKELDNIKESQKRPTTADSFVDSRSSYALSALADVSEWAAQQRQERPYRHVPQTLAPPPPPPPPPAPVSAPTPAIASAPASATREPFFMGPFGLFNRPASRASSLRFKNILNGDPPTTTTTTTTASPVPLPIPASNSTLLTSTPDSTDRIATRPVSSSASGGPGQAIAPAPPKPRYSVFRHTNGRSGLASALSLAGVAPQQFIFQPPQQPFQHQAAPGRPRSRAGSRDGIASAGGSESPAPQFAAANAARTNTSSPAENQRKMTFVNQTIASRNAAAASAGSTPPKGGQRMLLPKV
ncbi:hypothetical protein EDD37DRAFT_622115 [Exophiala viscosa]|uniref:uncharacterized protein n=1 Tax=Exophiala viscosa TaxID=2486360 RepID=UPI00218F4205|nr:hypothetical protein EDD37DRAFT_622115 [Exophiala viscosa]